MPERENRASELGFTFVRNVEHDVWTKVRDNGHRGRAVGDEAALWQAWQAEKQRVESLEARLAALERHCGEVEHCLANCREEAESLRADLSLIQDVPADDRPKPKRR